MSAEGGILAWFLAVIILICGAAVGRQWWRRRPDRGGVGSPPEEAK